MARSSEFGGGPIGSLNLAAGGENPLSMREMPEGPCEGVDLTIGFSLKSTAAAFNAVVDTGSSMAAEGVDDIDLITNAIYSKLQHFWDKQQSAFNLTPAQLRTTLAILELRDIIATLLNGTSIPVSTGSAAAFLLHFYIPVQLNHYVADGNLFMNGSERLKTGTLFAVTNSTLTPTVVLANGSAVVSANIFRAVARGGTGDRGDVGNTWTMLRQLGLPTIHNFELDRPRLGLFDVLPAASNGATGISIGDFESLNPSDYASYFASQRIGALGNAADITTRVTPYIWPSPNARVDDMVARFLKGPPRLVIAAGVSSVGVYDLQVVSPPESAESAVAARVGGGGDVSVAHVKPHSVPNGSRVPAYVASFLPKRIVPPGMNGGVGTTQKPEGVAASSRAALKNRDTLISVARSRR